MRCVYYTCTLSLLLMKQACCLNASEGRMNIATLTLPHIFLQQKHACMLRCPANWYFSPVAFHVSQKSRNAKVADDTNVSPHPTYIDHHFKNCFAYIKYNLTEKDPNLCFSDTTQTSQLHSWAITVHAIKSLQKSPESGEFEFPQATRGSEVLTHICLWKRKLRSFIASKNPKYNCYY